MLLSELLKDKVVLIAGGATGIGKTGAHLFAQQGAKVIIADLNYDEGEKTVGEIKSQGSEASFLHVDLGSVAEIERMVGIASDKYGKLDTFWHNAGGSCLGHIEFTTEEDFDKQIAINLKAAVFGAKFVIPEIRKAGGGCILFTSSMVGLRPSPYRPSYSLTYGVAKAGVVMLVRCLTEPMARYNIRVNCICPGPVPTSKQFKDRKRRAQTEGISFDEFVKASTERIPLKREMTEEEIAKAALFLVSDMASAITGVALPADGGFTAL